MSSSALTAPADQESPGPGAVVPPQSRDGAPGRIDDRSVSAFTALTRSIHEMGLMRRRYGYYWAQADRRRPDRGRVGRRGSS